MAENANALTRAYFERQKIRILATIAPISNRNVVAAGRVIPEGEDLRIHDGRRLEATVLFLDISKFSARPSSTEQEQENLRQILSLFFTEMIRIVEDYGGVVEKNTGDGLMAYFVKDAADTVAPQQKAVAAALTMFSAAERILNPILIRSHLEPVNFRVTMDHGPITVAKVGAPRGFTGIVAIGATANIASKMLSSAEPGMLLLGEMVLSGLPQEWRNKFVKLKARETGWSYTGTDVPYAFYEYFGRWREPPQ